MRSDKNNTAYILHIQDALAKITGYTTSHTVHEFEENEWDQSAVLRYLEIIGEAASKLDTAFKQEHPEIPWREVSDLRNVIIHDYMNVDTSIIWKIISVDVPTLKEQIKKIL